MNHPYIYLACFIPYHKLLPKLSDIQRTCLDRIIYHPHVTVRYRPEDVDETLFGTPVRIRVTGYGNDGRNEGLGVSLSTENPELQKLTDGIEVPHITLSVAAGSNAADTRNLTFLPIEPFEITGRYGGFITDSRIITRPPKNE